MPGWMNYGAQSPVIPEVAKPPWYRSDQFRDWASAAGMHLLGSIGQPSAYSDAFGYGFGALQQGQHQRAEEEKEEAELARRRELEFGRLTQQRAGWEQRDVRFGYAKEDRSRLLSELEEEKGRESLSLERSQGERESLIEALQGRSDGAQALALAEFDRTGSMLAAMKAAESQYPTPGAIPQIENRDGVLYENRGGNYRLIGQAPRPSAPSREAQAPNLADSGVRSLTGTYYKAYMSQDPARDPMEALEEAQARALRDAGGQQRGDALQQGPVGQQEGAPTEALPQTTLEARTRLRDLVDSYVKTGQIDQVQADDFYGLGLSKLRSFLVQGMSPAEAFQATLDAADF